MKASDPGGAAPRFPTWQLILPADWWQIPLVDPAEREAAADGLAAHQCRTLDDSAESRRARERVRDEVRGMADAAARNGGRMLAISTAVVEELPMACVLVVGVTESGLGRGVDATRLAAKLANDPGAPPQGRVEVADLVCGSKAVRQEYRRTEHVGPGAEIETSHVDFHIPVPCSPGDLLRLLFSTPMPEPAATATLALADAIADSLAWHRDASEE